MGTDPIFLIRERSAFAKNRVCPHLIFLAIGDRVLEDADLVDLDLDLVAGLHPDRRVAARADAAGRAGDEHVARLQRGPARDVLDDLRDLEDHLLGGGVLHALAVQAARQRQSRIRRNLVRGHHPRTEGAGVREVLAGGPLHGMALPVAHRALVVAAVARDVAPRLLLRDAAARSSDDYRDLRLVVGVLRFARAEDRLLVADLRLRHAQEDRRLLGVVAPGLDHVVLVVQADTDDLVRIRDHRQPGDIRLLVIGRLGGVLRRLGESVAADQRLEIGEAIADVALQVDDALAGDDAVARALCGLESGESHGRTALRVDGAVILRRARGSGSTGSSASLMRSALSSRLSTSRWWSAAS